MKWWKVTLVIFSAVVITALGIDATDTFTGSRDTLLSQVITYNERKCPKGMIRIDTSESMTCVDMYEVSASDKCPSVNPEQMMLSIRNVDYADCVAESKPDVVPWRFITRDQAMQMCSRAGKRLPTSKELYSLSLGMSRVESSCNVNSKKVSTTGSFDTCISPSGVYDLIGNVWEWTSDDVIDGMYNTIRLPKSGYVAQVDSSGMTTVSSDEPQELFGEDYFWSKQDGVFAIIRGGYFDSEKDGGIYTVHADTLPTTASIGIGFRCVK